MHPSTITTYLIVSPIGLGVFQKQGPFVNVLTFIPTLTARCNTWCMLDT